MPFIYSSLFYQLNNDNYYSRLGILVFLMVQFVVGADIAAEIGLILANREVHESPLTTEAHSIVSTVPARLRVSSANAAASADFPMPGMP